MAPPTGYGQAPPTAYGSPGGMTGAPGTGLRQPPGGSNPMMTSPFGPGQGPPTPTRSASPGAAGSNPGMGRYASYAEWYYASVIDDTLHGGDAFHRRVYGDDFEYRDFAPMFRAELFDPDQWADLFARSGARYVVLTSKHHDGFCLWPTSSPYKRGWNSMEVGPHRDLLGELTEAVRRRGLRMGLYYNLIEWESSWTHRRPSGYYLRTETVEKYRIPEEEYVTGHVLPQLRELVLRYEPALIFSDGGEWDGSESDIYTLAETDSSGYFELPDPLERGQSYSIIVWAEGYLPATGDNLLVGDEPSPLEIEVTLQQE